MPSLVADASALWSGLAGLRFEPVGIGRDLSQQVPGMAQEPSLGWSRLDDALAAPPCFAAYSNALAVALSCNLALQVATFSLVLAMARMKTKFGGQLTCPSPKFHPPDLAPIRDPGLAARRR